MSVPRLRFGTDGACVLNPHGSGRIPATLAVRSYPVVERHTMLWIWMGTDEADPDLIPDFSYLDPGAPGVLSKRDWIEMDVDYQLVIDNLLDLSHASFLHVVYSATRRHSNATSRSRAPRRRSR